MKSFFILILFTLISYSQKEKKVTSFKHQNIAKFIVEPSQKIENLGFEELLKELRTKKIPLTEATNFDTFIEERKIYNKEEVKILQLDKIYANYYNEKQHYRSTPNYKIELSKNFYAIVISVFKGNHEMESLLINYDLKGKIIDYKVVSFDEVAENIFRIESRIEQDKLTIKSIVDLEEKSDKIEVFKIDVTGKINRSKEIHKALEGKNLIEDVIVKLKLNKQKINYDFAATKVQPHNANETIIVIPEIAFQEEDIFKFNSYIVLVDNITGKITHTYFESSKTNGWDSDAIILSEITIDTAPYILAKSTRAFGIRLYHYSMSQPNPYGNKTISLFVKSENTLKKVLSNYDVMNYNGEWNTICAGEFTDVKNILIMSKKMTNNYFDIIVKSKITKTKSFKDKNGECDDTQKIYVKTKWLKFNGEEYVEKNEQ